MALSLIQAGANLQIVDEDGVLSDPLILPAGVTLRTDIPPRFTASNNYVILVNTPSQPLTIDATGKVRLLSPAAPRLAPTIAGQAGGTLSGTYGGVRYTFVTLDSNFNIISESDYSPGSNTVTITSQFLRVTGLDTSPDEITLRRLYRTTSNGAILYQWVDLDGNILTSIQDDLADAGLSLFGAPILGTPPHLTTIGEFRGRLFGGSDTERDILFYTEAGLQYAWPSDNRLVIPPVGADQYGIVALAPRREALGVGRRNTLLQITGSGAEDSNGIPDLDVVILSKELGIESQESVRVFRDTAYFLWKDGVYSWGSEGLKCVSDGVGDKGNVRSWFVNDYFNVDMYPQAFAHIDQNYPIYRLFLASFGSNEIDTWVEYNITDGTWWGPHRTALFSPLSAFNRTNTSNNNIAVIGGPTAVYNDQTPHTDGVSTPIEFSVFGKRHDLGEPDEEKYYGELSIFGKKQSSGTTQIITVTGDLDATTQISNTWDMTKSRQRLGRAGLGKHMQVRFYNNAAGEEVVIYGYDVNPAFIVGRR
jgi:hypothetical protein